MKRVFQRLLMTVLLTTAVGGLLYAQDYQLASPDGSLHLDISNDPELHYSLSREGKTLVKEVKIGLSLENGTVLGKGDKVKKAKKSSENIEIHPVVPIKNSVIPDQYNQLSLQFKKGYSVTFRAYNDAVAYRFETQLRQDTINVEEEQFEVTLPQHTEAWFSLLDGKDNVRDRWMTSYEHMYSKMPVSDLGADRSELPLLIDLSQDGKLLITESNLHDYPGLYLTGDEKGSLKSIFPPRVKTEVKNVKGERGWDRTIHPESVYPYLSRTSGARTFPWRIMATAREDKDLLNNEIVYKLGEPNRLEHTDWIKPGLVSWDWWNHWNLTGVDFRAGINNDTYRFYIDFAARNHIPYIIMDDGWYELGDLTKEAPDIDVASLVNYGASKGVGVMLWCSWKTLSDQMTEALDLFEKWGVKGIKVDFMDRDDQAMVNFYYRCANEAAEHHLLVDYHGAHKPTGLNRTYPNIVNYEGVVGLEQNKWSDDRATPDNAVTLPFIRMFTGPMDYTPGAMRNAQKADFRPIGNYPMSMGTRCQQIAMYVLYDSPLQMLSDNPVIYEKNKETLDFIRSIPTTWDETIPLSGAIGQYFAMARKKDQQYFVGAMSSWEPRDIELNFDFLPDGEWNIEIFQDGVNADRNGIDYQRVTKKISKSDVLNVHLAPGGGWAARISK